MEHRLKLGVKNELLVVFSPINIPKGKFGFTRFFSDLKQHVLFFNCENTWYVDCIDEMKSAFEDAVSIQKRHKADCLWVDVRFIEVRKSIQFRLGNPCHSLPLGA